MSRTFTFLWTPWSLIVSSLIFVVAVVVCFIAWRRSGYRRSVALLELLRFAVVVFEPGECAGKFVAEAGALRAVGHLIHEPAFRAGLGPPFISVEVASSVVDSALKRGMQFADVVPPRGASEVIPRLIVQQIFKTRLVVRGLTHFLE